MTDKAHGITVALDKDYRVGKDDDVDQIVKAIKMIKGVATATPKVVAGHEYMHRGRIAAALYHEVCAAIEAATELPPNAAATALSVAESRTLLTVRGALYQAINKLFDPNRAL